MIVLGIDPGTASTGYGVVSGTGARMQERRLCDIHARVCALIDAHKPDALAIEQLYFGANVRTAFAVGQARGVVMLAAGQRGLPARSYTPQQVKSAVCGYGGADKIQVGRMVMRLLSLDAIPTPDHAADALAVAVCDLNRSPLAAAISAGAAPSTPAGPAAPVAPARAPARPVRTGRGVSNSLAARARAGAGG
jgi:crossover junction endodeoxyribonuclease RuvC